MNRDCYETCSPACPEFPCLELTAPPALFFVYVAGRLSGDPGEYLANVHEMALACRELMAAGFCPINPAGDLVEGLASGTPISVRQYQARSRDLLKLCAFAIGSGAGGALLVISDVHRDGRPSGGVCREIELADELGIPVVRSVAELHALRGSWSSQKAEQ